MPKEELLAQRGRVRVEALIVGSSIERAKPGVEVSGSASAKSKSQVALVKFAF